MQLFYCRTTSLRKKKDSLSPSRSDRAIKSPSYTVDDFLQVIPESVILQSYSLTTLHLLWILQHFCCSSSLFHFTVPRIKSKIKRGCKRRERSDQNQHIQRSSSWGEMMVFSRCCWDSSWSGASIPRTKKLSRNKIWFSMTRVMVLSWRDEQQQLRGKETPPRGRESRLLIKFLFNFGSLSFVTRNSKASWKEEVCIEQHPEQKWTMPKVGPSSSSSGESLSDRTQFRMMMEVSNFKLNHKNVVSFEAKKSKSNATSVTNNRHRHPLWTDTFLEESRSKKVRDATQVSPSLWQYTKYSDYCIVNATTNHWLSSLEKEDKGEGNNDSNNRKTSDAQLVSPLLVFDLLQFLFSFKRQLFHALLSRRSHFTLTFKVTLETDCITGCSERSEEIVRCSGWSEGSKSKENQRQEQEKENHRW